MLDLIRSKIQDWNTVQNTVSAWRGQQECIVFTNGCFDILHYGHIHYLAQARSLGDRLIVGLNAASSVQRLKGPGRPINDENTRTYLLAGLLCVDAVVVFEEDTPLELIKLIQPDVLVKGGDWQTHQIVGSDIVLAKGGEVQSLRFIEGYSTTAIEKRIKRGNAAL